MSELAKDPNYANQLRHQGNLRTLQGKVSGTIYGVGGVAFVATEVAAAGLIGKAAVSGAATGAGIDIANQTAKNCKINFGRYFSEKNTISARSAVGSGAIGAVTGGTLGQLYRTAGKETLPSVLNVSKWTTFDKVSNSVKAGFNWILNTSATGSQEFTDGRSK